MPGNNGFGFYDDKSIFPSRPKAVKQDPKQSIPSSQPGARVFSVEHAQLLPQGENFKTEIVSRTEKGTEKKEITDGMCDHRLGLISYLFHSGADLKRMISHDYEVLTTRRA